MTNGRVIDRPDRGRHDPPPLVKSRLSRHLSMFNIFISHSPDFDSCSSIPDFIGRR